AAHAVPRQGDARDHLARQRARPLHHGRDRKRLPLADPTPLLGRAPRHRRGRRRRAERPAQGVLPAAAPRRRRMGDAGPFGIVPVRPRDGRGRRLRQRRVPRRAARGEPTPPSRYLDDRDPDHTGGRRQPRLPRRPLPVRRGGRLRRRHCLARLRRSPDPRDPLLRRAKAGGRAGRAGSAHRGAAGRSARRGGRPNDRTPRRRSRRPPRSAMTGRPDPATGPFYAATPSLRAWLARLPWPMLGAGWALAYLVGLAFAAVIHLAGWWERGGEWERAVLIAVHDHVSPALDVVMLWLPLVG